jgi:hypothetical protein
MALTLSILFAASAALLAGLVLKAIFKSLNPANIGGYRACKGGWWEAKLNNCQAGLLIVPQQPVNTYTNVAYLAGGFFLMFKLQTLPSYVLGLASLYLCAGSALYHATSTRWAGSLDVSSMYAVFSALAVYSFSALIRISDPLTALLMFVAAALAAYFLRYYYHGTMEVKIGIFLVITYALTLWSRYRNQATLFDGYLIASLVIFALAEIAWILDKAGKFPLPRWGHGVWHVLTAIAISILFYVIHLTR